MRLIPLRPDHKDLDLRAFFAPHQDMDETWRKSHTMMRDFVAFVEDCVEGSDKNFLLSLTFLHISDPIEPSNATVSAWDGRYTIENNAPADSGEGRQKCLAGYATTAAEAFQIMLEAFRITKELYTQP